MLVWHPVGEHLYTLSAFASSFSSSQLMIVGARACMVPGLRGGGWLASCVGSATWGVGALRTLVHGPVAYEAVRVGV